MSVVQKYSIPLIRQPIDNFPVNVYGGDLSGNTGIEMGFNGNQSKSYNMTKSGKKRAKKLPFAGDMTGKSMGTIWEDGTSQEPSSNLTEDAWDASMPADRFTPAGTVADDGNVADGTGGWLPPSSSSGSSSSSTTTAVQDSTLLNTINTGLGDIGKIFGKTTPTTPAGTGVKPPATTTKPMSPLTWGLIIVGVLGIGFAAWYFGEHEGAPKTA